METACGAGKRSKGGLAVGTGTHVPLVDVEDDTIEIRHHELAQIIHDLKNPLSSIALEAELLDARVGVGDRSDVQRAIGRIVRNVTFLDRLVHDLMDACLMSNGRLVLRRTPCDLHDLLAGVIERVVPRVDRARVVLEAEPLALISVDALRIERVVANLLDNALKYTPRNASIVIRLHRDADGAQVSIRDSGPGLTAHEMSTIFDAYTRTDRSLTHAGHGLGLHVSKQIIEAHGGHIGVESVRDWGACFFFALPFA